MANTQRVDDFDMVKLQRSLKQQQRRSQRMHGVVTKLSPAEVRSLNNVAAPRSLRKSASASTKKPGFSTPPLTPENVASNRHAPGGGLPTPPHSPDDTALRRSSANSSNDVPIHSPMPVSHTRPNFVTTNHHSRPSSVSSHHSMPTYRGNEITRSGSISMLIPSVPTHHIVDNPLSQFSRPRQSIGGGSVSPVRHEPRRQAQPGSADWTSRHDHLGHHSDNIITPPPSVGSATSAREREADTALHTESAEPGITRAETIAVDGSMSSKPSSRFSWHWKRNVVGPDVSNNETAEVKKSRRRTIAWGKSPNSDTTAVAYESTKPGHAPEIKRTLKGDLPSDKAQSPPEPSGSAPEQVEQVDHFPTVHAPNSADSKDSPSLGSDKGKQKEETATVPHDVFADESIPMYSQCSCCGKLKNPLGNRALSPVPENENSRMSSSLGIENIDNIQNEHRGSSSASREKHTPTPPMVLPEGRTVQARILPQEERVHIFMDPSPPPVNERGDIIARGSEPVPLAPKKAEEKERKVVRFSSLHLKEEMERQPRRSPPPTESAQEKLETAGLSSSQEHTNRSRPQYPLHEPTEPPGTVVNGLRLGSGSETDGADIALPSIPPSIPSDMTGALIAVMDGVDTTFGDILKDIDEQIEGSAVAGPVSDDGSRLVQPRASTLAEVRQPVASQETTFMSKSPAEPYEVSLQSDTSQTPVVDESLVLVQQPAILATKPKSILKPTPRSSYNNSPRTSVDWTYNMPTSYDASSPSVSRTGSFSTKPKATAKYMLTSSSEMRTPPMTTRTTTTTSMQGNTITTTTTTSTASARASPRYTGSKPTIGSRNASSDSLSSGQRRPQSSRSNSSFSDPPTSSRRSRNSLMDSVLAATKQDKRSKFERALGRV